MAIRFSTGLRNNLLGRQAAGTGNGFAGTLYQSVIRVYSGTQPSSADSAPTGTLLGTISKDAADATQTANGLIFAAPSGGSITKNTDTWKMIGVAAGTAGWARLCTIADDGSVSTTLPRVDMSIAVTGGNMNMSSTSVAVGSPHTVDTFQVDFPAS